jgi:hypothetical protein
MTELHVYWFGRRGLSPFDGGSSLVVVADVTKDFSGEIVDGRKDASSEDLPLNFGEPDFDLVKRGRIGGCKMNAHLRIGQKVLDEFGFVGREIISDDVDLMTRRLGGHYMGKKIDELGAVMALSGLAKDFATSGCYAGTISIASRAKGQGYPL